MAGERHLIGRAEDAQVGAVSRLDRRQHEHRLGQIELARDRLHALVAQPFGIQDDGELVAGERLLGEDVEKSIAAHRGCLADRIGRDSSHSTRRVRGAVVMAIIALEGAA